MKDLDLSHGSSSSNGLATHQPLHTGSGVSRLRGPYSFAVQVAVLVAVLDFFVVDVG